MAPVPTPPDQETATVEDWEEFKQLYAGWLETATDDEIKAEMVALPVDGRPFTDSEAWRHQQCELRRRRPPTAKAKRTSKE